ncbi:MAG TPA: ABC transporter permease [Gemmatimonadaceae bacterium]|nr:ABC transporter permease [Gemmatimonadaceae bacterium]
MSALAPTVRGWHTPAEMWRYREMLRSLVVRNLKVKYQRSLLGFLWTLLNPILTLAVLATVFSIVVRIPVPQYWAFLVSGYFCWNFVMQVIGAGPFLIAEHAPLRRSIAFPGEVLVLGAALARLVEFGAEMFIALVALIVFRHHGIPLSFVTLPVLVLLLLLLAVGLMMPVATLAVFYHDVQHALPIVLLILFYVSPVFYPARMVPAALRGIYLLNPIARLLTLFQTVLYDGRMPSAAAFANLFLIAIPVCLVGYAIFARYQAVFAEIV